MVALIRDAGDDVFGRRVSIAPRSASVPLERMGIYGGCRLRCLTGWLSTPRRGGRGVRFTGCAAAFAEIAGEVAGEPHHGIPQRQAADLRIGLQQLGRAGLAQDGARVAALASVEPPPELPVKK